jgi:2,3-bisphosphoglycerate-dependent phosphoglycerate mutase
VRIERDSSVSHGAGVKHCTLWIIRHGETDWNVAGRLQGQLEVPLNVKGLAQAQRLAARLVVEHQRAPFAAIYSSDLGRAAQTAEETSRRLGLAVIAQTGLRERHFGVLSKLTLAEAEVSHPELFARLKARDPEFVPEGGESLTQMFARSVAALSDIARAWPGAQVLVVTHGGVLDSAWRKAKQFPLQVKRDHELLNASINRVTVLGDQFELAGWADVAHL